MMGSDKQDQAVYDAVNAEDTQTNGRRDDEGRMNQLNTKRTAQRNIVDCVVRTNGKVPNRNFVVCFLDYESGKDSIKCLEIIPRHFIIV